MDIYAFTEALYAAGYSDRTVSEYRKWIRRLAAWARDHGLDVATLDAGHLRQWADTLPRSWATCKQAHAAARHYYRMVGRLDEPWHAIRVPRKPRPKYRGIEQEAAGQLRDAALMVGGRPGTAVLLLLYTGARAAEVAAMRWDGVDGGVVRWWRSKTSEWHEVPLHPVLERALDAFREATGAPSHYLFPGAAGRAHVSAATVWEWVGHVSETAGVGHVTPQQLRATAGTTVLEATNDLDAAAEFLGHRDTTVTRTHYTRTSKRRLDAAVAALDY